MTLSTLGIKRSTVKTVVFKYDYSVHGGDIGNIYGDYTVPAGSIVLRTTVVAHEVFEGAGTTVTFALDDFIGYTIKSVSDLDEADYMATDIQSSSAYYRANEESRIKMTIADVALTAGIYSVIIEYI